MPKVITLDVADHPSFASEAFYRADAVPVLARALGLLRTSAGRPEQVFRAGEMVRPLLATRMSVHQYIRARYVLAEALRVDSQLAEAIAHLDEAVALACAKGLTTSAGTLLVRRGLVSRWLVRYTEAAADWEQALTLHSRGSPPHRAVPHARDATLDLLVRLSVAYTSLARGDRARERLHEASRLAESYDVSLAVRANLAWARAQLCSAAGDQVGALVQARLTAALHERAQDSVINMGRAQMLVAECALECAIRAEGEVAPDRQPSTAALQYLADYAEPALQAATRHAREARDHTGETEIMLARARITALRGEPGPAHALLDRVRERAWRHGQMLEIIRAYCIRGWLHERADKRELASSQYMTALGLVNMREEPFAAVPAIEGLARIGR